MESILVMPRCIRGLFVCLCAVVALVTASAATAQIDQPTTALPHVHIQNPPTATSIAFEGNTVISSAELQQASGLEVGRPITDETINAAVGNIRERYSQYGYIATVTNIRLPEQGKQGDVIIIIQEVRIAAVHFEGLHRVREKAIQRMLEAEPARLFNREVVGRDYLRLQQLGVFEDIKSDLFAVRPGEADLIWTVTEKAQFNYREVGGSYGPVGGLIGTGQVTFGNLRHRAEKLRVLGTINSVDARIGGEAEYYWPWIAPRNTSAVVNVYSEPRYHFSRALATQPGVGRYAEQHAGFNGTISRTLRPFVLGSVGLKYEAVSLSNFPSSLFITAESPNSSVLLGSLGTTLDRRDSAVSPNTGGFAVGLFEGGMVHQDSGGTSAMARIRGDRRWYLPLRPIQTTETGQTVAPVPVLALRTAGALCAGRVPFYEQFFAGGIGELPLRGFIEDRYWGRYALLGNAELRWPLTKDLSGVAFVDAGDAWGSDFQLVPGASPGFEQHRGFSPRIGTGFGLRYATQAGPVVLDFAFGDAFRTYFSIGQVF